MKTIDTYLTEAFSNHIKFALLISEIDMKLCEFAKENNIDPYAVFEVACELLLESTKVEDSPVSEWRRDMQAEERRNRCTNA